MLRAEPTSPTQRLAEPAVDALGTGGITLPETVVTAQADRGYAAFKATSATKTNTPILETPQAVSSVTRELMRDRGDVSLADALASVPGVTQRENYYFSDEFTIRGFYVDPTNGHFLDGRRVFNDVSFNTWMLEQVEVVKGPSSVLYGGIEPGGLIAMTSKRPLPERRFALQQDFGSWNDYRTSADVSVPFGTRSGVRLPLTYRQFDSFRDLVDDNHNFQMAPSVVLELGKHTDLALSLFYTDQKRVNDNVKIPVLNGKPVDIPRERFLGEPGFKESIAAAHVNATLTHRFTPKLTLRSSLYYGHSDQRQETAISVFGFEPGSESTLKNYSNIYRGTACM
jgi:iron complex outermembrane receptor protein